MQYPIVIVPLAEEDGGGFLAYAPDLRGCMSDGDTPGEAAINIEDAMGEWLDLFHERNPGIEPPAPFSADAAVAEERQHLVERLKQVTDARNELDGRLDALAQDIDDIRERIENIEAWSRFAKITAHAGAGEDQLPLLAAH